MKNQQYCQELYEQYKKLEKEINSHEAQIINNATGDVEASYISPEEFKEKNRVTKELWLNCQSFLDETLTPDEKSEIQKEAEKNMDC